MPIPIPTPDENQEDFIKRCIPEIIGEYSEEGQAYAICSSSYENSTQGGVVGSFGRTRFEFQPTHKEALNSFMARCMSDATVKEKKAHRPTRAGFCFSEYQNRYINNIGKKWK
jgi:hypothetical protein